MTFLRFPDHAPKRKYCKEHGIEYDGYICPECAKRITQEDKADKQKKQEKQGEQKLKLLKLQQKYKDEHKANPQGW